MAIIPDVNVKVAVACGGEDTFSDWYNGGGGVIGVKQELEDYSAYLQKELSKDPEEIDNAIQILIGYLGRTVDILPEAQKYYENAKGNAAVKVSELYPSMSPSIAKSVIERECSLEGLALLKADRANAAITHTLECLRSRLSYQKEMHKQYAGVGGSNPK